MQGKESTSPQRVAVVGASPKPHRYAHRAMCLLAEKGHTPLPVSPRYNEILGRQVYAKLRDVPEPIDTVTLYVRAALQADVVEEALSLLPKRVIFNPGAENPAAYARLQAAGIEVIEACTLVLLSTGQF